MALARDMIQINLKHADRVFCYPTRLLFCSPNCWGRSAEGVSIPQSLTQALNRGVSRLTRSETGQSSEV